jgi:hypothetical protein
MDPTRLEPRGDSGSPTRASSSTNEASACFSSGPADRTRWNATERTVTFANADGTPLVVADGTTVVLGGGGDSSEESGVTPEAWLEGMTWVARPADGCPIDPWWGVGELALN